MAAYCWLAAIRITIELRRKSGFIGLDGLWIAHYLGRVRTGLRASTQILPTAAWLTRFSSFKAGKELGATDVRSSGCVPFNGEVASTCIASPNRAGEKIVAFSDL